MTPSDVSRRNETAFSDPARVLATAVRRAADKLGLSAADLARIIGRDRTSVARGGIDPASKAGELALLLVRVYRGLAVLVNDNPDQIRHWMRTFNSHTQGVPAEQVVNVAGLVRVCGYLDAVRAKV